MPDLVFPIESEEAIVARHQDQIQRIHDLLNLDPKLRDLLLTSPGMPIRRLIQFAGPLPASETNHDAEVYGMVRHTLTVMGHALEDFHRRYPKPAAGSSPADLHTWWSLQISLVVLAAVHDLGKLFDLMVRIPGSDRPWQPGRGPLLAEASAAKATEVIASWKYPRCAQGPRGHESLGVWLIPRIFDPKCLWWMNREHATDCCVSLMTSLGGRPTTMLSALLRSADHRACREDQERRRTHREQQRATGQVPPEAKHFVTLPAVGTESRAHDFLTIFREQADDFTYNRADADCLISATHTVVFIQDRGQKVSVLRRIYEAGRLAVSGEEFSPTIRQFYTAGRPGLLLDELAAISDPTSPAAPWCVWTGRKQPNGSGLAEITHYAVTVKSSVNRTVRRAPCLIFTNDVLWGDLDPLKEFGQGEGYDGPVAFLGWDKESPTADPEELGFVGLDRGDQASKAVTLSQRHTRQGGGEDQTVAAYEIARGIWDHLDHLAPLPAESGNAIHASWRALAKTLAEASVSGPPQSRSGDDLLLLTMAAIADRLSDLAAAKDRGTVTLPASTAAPAQAAPTATTEPVAPAAATPPTAFLDHLLGGVAALARGPRALPHPTAPPRSPPLLADSQGNWVALRYPDGLRLAAGLLGDPVPWPGDARALEVLESSPVPAIRCAEPPPDRHPLLWPIPVAPGEEATGLYVLIDTLAAMTLPWPPVADPDVAIDDLIPVFMIDTPTIPGLVSDTPHIDLSNFSETED